MSKSDGGQTVDGLAHFTLELRLAPASFQTSRNVSLKSFVWLRKRFPDQMFCRTDLASEKLLLKSRQKNAGWALAGVARLGAFRETC